MFSKVARYMDKVISYPSRLLVVVAGLAMVFVMLAVSADVFMRYVFDSPIQGTWDLVGLCFAIIVWGPMALAALKGSHVRLTFVPDKMPRLPRLGLQLLGELVTAVMLGVVSWRLVVHAMWLGSNQTATAALRIPYAPLAYFVAVACGVMALAFLAKVPRTLGEIRKEPGTVGKTQKEPDALGKMEKMKGGSV